MGLRRLQGIEEDLRCFKQLMLAINGPAPAARNRCPALGFCLRPA